ncbi:hypothetical protein GCM10025787_40210 [Saccharopolyspora rosea]
MPAWSVDGAASLVAAWPLLEGAHPNPACLAAGTVAAWCEGPSGSGWKRGGPGRVRAAGLVVSANGKPPACGRVGVRVIPVRIRARPLWTYGRVVDVPRWARGDETAIDFAPPRRDWS